MTKLNVGWAITALKEYNAVPRELIKKDVNNMPENELRPILNTWIQGLEKTKILENKTVFSHIAI